MVAPMRVPNIRHLNTVATTVLKTVTQRASLYYVHVTDPGDATSTVTLQGAGAGTIFAVIQGDTIESYPFYETRLGAGGLEVVIAGATAPNVTIGFG